MAKDIIHFLLLAAVINGSIATKPGPNGMEGGDVNNRFGDDQEESDIFTAFDIEVLRHIIKNSDGKNVVWSPASMKFNLGILYEASKGKTATELSNLLGLNNNRYESLRFLRDFYKILKTQNEGVKLKMATRILTNNRLNVKPDFEKSVVNNFQARVSKDDFSNSQSLARDINKWVNISTEGHIPKLVEEKSFDPRALVVILNVIFFKGEWQKKFDASVTADADFYINENESKKTKTMINMGRYKYAEFNSLNVKALALPYKDGDNMMIILLPDKGHSLQEVSKNLSYLTLSTILNALKEQNVRVTLPKFSIDYDFKIKPFLEKEGVKEIFGDNADLTYMLDEKNKGKLSDIIHKAKIIVNEKGTTAAAATGSFVVPLTIVSKVDFEVNRPFMFFIVNKNSMIIFEGIFVNPDGGAIRKSQQALKDYTTSKVEYNTPTKPYKASVHSGVYPPRPNEQQTEGPFKFL